jgi:tRNA threonylcarbamoyladenosine biosynthesis protein TsaB
MARILLIETATEVCSAAIATDGRIVASVEESQATSHAALLTLQIEACAREAGIPLAALDAVAVSQGPGAYTSLRVGASVAKGICYALDKPLIAINTLRALAHASHAAIRPDEGRPAYFLPMLDARRQEVWLAVFDVDLRLVVPEQPLILENDLFQNFAQTRLPHSSGGALMVSGNGGKKLENVPLLENVVFSPIKKCAAAHLAALAENSFQTAVFQDLAYFEPFYMKAPNITTPNKVL